MRSNNLTKKFSGQEFRDRVLGYYGCKKSKTVSKAKSVVVSRHFDDGISSGLSLANGQYNGRREYDVAASRDGWLAEYEVMQTSHGHGYTESFFVEPFEDSADNKAKQPVAGEKKEGCKCGETGVDAKKEAAVKAVEEADKIKNEALQNVSMPNVPEATPGTKKDKVTDDDFLSDIKSILSGSKTYDPNARKAVEKTPSDVRQQAQSRREEEIQPIETKNEHQIFDKIAQSMKYANAYDLGSFAIEQRFDDFDKFDDIKAKTETKKSEMVSASSRAKDYKGEVFAEDFLADMDMIAKESSKEKPGGGTQAKPPAKIPLDPGVGGRSIMVSAMNPGDIIISTTDAAISKKIRQATGSEVSHASVYIGDGNVIESIEDGVLQFTVETSVMDDSVAVAYRHKDMTPEKAALVVAFLKDAKDKKRKFDYMGLLRVAPYQLISSYCNGLPEALRDACRTAADKFKLGTDNNDEFYCSELVFAAFKHAGLNISDVDPHWSAPQDVVRLNHNNTLQYVGHLKTM